LSSSVDGLVLLEKPPGITSFETLSVVKSRLRTGKVGHTGTLDKFAEGLLLVLTGSYTKLAPLFSDLDKEYLVEIEFGKETETLDPEGTVLHTGAIPTLDSIGAAREEFLGNIRQVPPLYSAVHHGGKRAYQLARRGKNPKLASREVRIHGIELLGYDQPCLKVRIHCSKGTYIRSIARDWGRAVESRAYVRSLERTGVGPFRVDEAVVPSRFEPARHLRRARSFLGRLPDLSIGLVRPESVIGVLHGSPIADGIFVKAPVGNGRVAAFDGDDKLLAIVYREDGRYRYQSVLAKDV
jgi:tRNA pseudouridine55 synthase